MSDSEVQDFECERGGLAEELRVPLVSSPYPRWSFLVAVCVGHEPWQAERPTDDELRQVSEWIAVTREYWFNERWLAKMAERPFDIDGGHNTLTLMKRPDGGWCYRRASWTMGPPLYPSPRPVEPVLSLAEVIEHIETVSGETSERFTKWRERVDPLGFIPCPACGAECDPNDSCECGPECPIPARAQ